MTGASGIKNRSEPVSANCRTPQKSRPLDVPVMANIAISNSTAIGSPKHHTSMASSAATPLPQLRYGSEVHEESKTDQQAHSRNASLVATSPTPSQTSSGSGKSGKFFSSKILIMLWRYIFSVFRKRQTIGQNIASLQRDSSTSGWSNLGRAQNRRAHQTVGRGDGTQRGARRILWHMSHLRRQSNGRRPGMSGNGQSVSHELFHMLFVWSRFTR